MRQRMTGNEREENLMARRKMVMADGDELYLLNISNYIMEKAPQWELNIFTKVEKLIKYLENSDNIDILVVDESFVNHELEVLAKNTVRIVWSGSMAPVKGFETIRKYQKTENMLREILLKYSERVGSTESIQGSSHTKVSVFYSPAGGSGKTTLSLAMASAGAKKGFCILYLNLEEIDSVKDVLTSASGGLSDVFLALKTKGMNVGIKLETCVEKEGNSGFFYLSGVESISEYEEITKEDIQKLIQVVRGLSKYDLVIIDITSGFSDRIKTVLECADIIFMPVISTENAVAKVNRFLNEENIHEGYHSIINKLNMVVNCSNGSNVGKEIIDNNLLAKVKCNSIVPSLPSFVRRANVLRSGEAVWPVLEPLFQLISQV